jgi:hypothetical protein
MGDQAGCRPGVGAGSVRLSQFLQPGGALRSSGLYDLSLSCWAQCQAA